MKPITPPTPESILVRETRKMLGLTQQKFSELVGYQGGRYVRNWESGRVEARPMLLQWCRLMQIMIATHGVEKAIEIANGEAPHS